MKNVLLLCLSILKRSEKLNEYRYEFEAINKIKTAELYGYMTNEAPTKAIISELEEQGQHLDKIIMLCTSKVANKSVQLDAFNEERKNISRSLMLGMNLEKYEKEELENMQTQKDSEGKEIFELTKYTHKDFYIEKINQYALSVNKDFYMNHKITYVQVDIPNDVKDNELTKASLIAADRVTNDGEQVQLYIDYNGGPRMVPFMITAVSNLMKLRDVQIKKILSMNYDNKKVEGRKEIIPIQNMMPVFESFDLVTGINEYVRYGYINGLQAYFKNSRNKEISKILNEMEKFANNLQLCRTDEIMKMKGLLWEKLENYVKKNQSTDIADGNNVENTYKLLFLYVLTDIMEGCKEILNGELPDIIKWCVERGLVQQALTFCSEEMPRFLWEKRIFCPTETEEKAYEHFYRHEPMRGKYVRYDYADGRNSISRKAYNWMIKFLPNIGGDRDCIFLNDFEDIEHIKKIKTEIMVGKTGEIYLPPKTFSLEKMQSINFKNSKENLNRAQIIFNGKKGEKGEKPIKAERKNVATLLHLIKIGRAYSNLSSDNKLQELLTGYFLLKQQRNISNHASNDLNAWSYSYLCDIMTQMADVLKQVTAK